jgi:predicted RNA-binding Zn ribbon-like protein
MTTRPPRHPIAHPVDHAHVADLETCLDLVNTVELTDGIPEDHLPTAEDTLAWFTDRGLAHGDALRDEVAADPPAWLDRVRGTRAALREVWDAAVEGRPPAAEALDRLNTVLAHAPHATLRPALAGVAVGHRHEAADATAEALARVALPLVAAIEAGETARFRVCANDGCRWVFEDTSRGGRRRWCDMTTCGNRAKVRRFRSKRREANPAGADAAG